MEEIVLYMVKLQKLCRPRFTAKTRVLDKVALGIDVLRGSAEYGTQQAVLVFHRALGDSTEYTVTVDGLAHESKFGRAEVVVPRGQVVSYTITAKGFEAVSGEVTAIDVNKDIYMTSFIPIAGGVDPGPGNPEEPTKYTISISATPAAASISLGDLSGIGTLSGEFVKGTTVTHTVSLDGYQSANGSVVVEKDEVITVVLEAEATPPVVVPTEDVAVGGVSDFGNESVAINALPDLSASTAMTSIKGGSIALSSSFESPRLLSLVATNDITVGGTAAAPMEITGTQPKSQGNASLSLNAGGAIVVKNVTFKKEDGAYNGLEIGLTKGVNPTSVLIENVNFENALANNAILIFGTTANATITIRNCTFTAASNAVRLSNKEGVAGVTVLFENCHLLKSDDNPSYRGFVVFEDHSSTSAAQALSRNIFGSDKMSITFKNCTIGEGDNAEVINFTGNVVEGAPFADGAVNPKQAYYTYYHKGFGEESATGPMPYVAANYPQMVFEA